MVIERDWLGPLINQLIDELATPRGVWAWGVLALCLALAWGVGHRLDHYLAQRPRLAMGTRGGCGWVQRLGAPGLAWLFLTIAHTGLARVMPVTLLSVAMALFGSLALIRGVLLVLRQTFLQAPWMEGLERSLSVLIWAVVALHVLGVLPALLDALDAWAIPLGKSKLSFLQVITGILTVSGAMILALWLSRSLDARLAAAPVPPGARAVLARLAQPILVVVALLIALPLVGIDLTTLSVFGGALGVGLGLGMQKIAANYVAGFIILLDESIEPGRLIRVDRHRGVVSEIRTRYTVLRGNDGVDAIVPNEMLVSAVVESETFGSATTRVAIQVGIGYASDVERAMALLIQVAHAHPRVLRDPAPAAFLVAFGDSAMTLELGVWINDPQIGTLALRSDLNLAVWRAFNEAGIEIPVPQRELTIKERSVQTLRVG
jgi:small-conductance mechanosensitive channel